MSADQQTAASASIPTCAVVLMAALLAGCDPVADTSPLYPVRYSDGTTVWAERATGCLFASAKGRHLRPVLRQDRSQAGCRATTANSVGMSEANAPIPPVKTGEGGT